MHYCPECGSHSLSSSDNHQFVCQECDFVYFHNVASAVMAAVVREHNGTQLLVATRSREPGKGLLDLPGGFVDPDESAETALRRELQEEIGVSPESFHYLTSFPNTYPYRTVVYKTCDLVFKVTLLPNAKVQAADDVESLEWITLSDLDTERFAFESTKRAVVALKQHLNQD